MKKILAVAMAAVMGFSFTACGGSAPSEAQSAASGDAAYTVGICQLVTHPALDAASQGFMDAIEEALPGQVEFNMQNAANDSNTCNTIVNSFVSNGVDLILANATPSLQAAATATADIPVLGTAVTEYGVALNIEDFNGTVGTNVPGTSDLAPLDQQAAIITELFPEAKKVALVYCSGEPNSQYQVDMIQKYLADAGVESEMFSFADSNDVSAVTQTACDYGDVVYVPTDNTVASNTGIIDGICQPAGVPVITGEEGMCKGCGVATLSISYYELGQATGKMAVKILTGEANVAEMPVEYNPTFTKKYNPVISEALGVTIPDGYEAVELTE